MLKGGEEIVRLTFVEIFTVFVTPVFSLPTALPCFLGASLDHKSMFSERKNGKNDFTLEIL